MVSIEEPCYIESLRIWRSGYGFLSAASLDLNAKIFVVRRGTRFSGVYMESVVSCEQEEGNLRVDFITMPGFKIGDSVIKSQVSKTER